LIGGIAKITDFGLARSVTTLSIAASQKGTKTYLPPEVYNNGSGLTHKSDIWALGIILYELANNGKFPFDYSDSEILRQSIKTCNYRPLSQDIDPIIAGLITKMLSMNPKDRPDIKDIITHPYIFEHVRNIAYRGQYGPEF
jgi:serine/threonine protein kinase